MYIKEICEGHAVHVQASDCSTSVVIASGEDYYNSIRYRFLLRHKSSPKSSLYVAKVGKGKFFAKDKRFINPEEAPKYARMIANRMFELF